MFAVVQFITESTNQDVSVSEVPASWISDYQKQCWWPPGNTGIYIARHKQPNPETWKLYPIKVECFCATLQEAKKRARAITSSDDDSVRAIKPNRKYNTDQFELDYVNEYPDKLASPPLSLPIPPTSLTTPSGLTPLSTTEDDFDTRISKAIMSNEDTSSSSATSVNAETHILDISQNRPDDVHPPTNAVLLREVPTGTNHNCCRNFDIIIQLITEINIKVTELKETMGNTQASFSREQLDMITNKLPCKSIEELQELEGSILTDKRVEESLKHLMNSIGRDFTQRLLKKLLTNELAELCSWTGARHNFELQKLAIVECAYGAVIRYFQITRKEFEMHVKDWLRHAKQRKERQNK